MLEKPYMQIKNWAFSGFQPHGSTLGLFRSLLALSTLLTLAFNSTHVLFRPSAGTTASPSCIGLGKWSLFCITEPSHLEIARLIAMFILFLVIIGFLPKLISLLHWWVGFSLQVSATTIDGGEQVVAVLTLLILPLCWTDRRKNHWLESNKEDDGQLLGLICAKIFYVFMRFQISIIYFQSAVAKMYVSEWNNGTALYYWFSDPMFGVPKLLYDILKPVIYSSEIVIITWLVILLEMMIALGLLLSNKMKTYLLLVGIAFHMCIGVFLGIYSFALAMIAALLIYLYPKSNVQFLSFRYFRKLRNGIKDRNADTSKRGET